MMRRATIRIASTRQLDLVCSLHDAFYINSQESKKDVDIALLVDCMDQACRDILGTQVQIPVETNVYNSITGYRDRRADQIESMLQGVLTDQLAGVQPGCRTVD